MQKKILIGEEVKMSKLLWGGKLNTRILKMAQTTTEASGNSGGNSGGSHGTSSLPPGPDANSAELNIYKILGVGQQELVFSDYVNPINGIFTISADDVEDWGNGRFKARVGGIDSNEFTVSLSETVPKPISPATVNAKHYRFTPQRSIVETVINEVVGVDNGKVDVPVQFAMNYSVFNIAPPGYPNPGNLQVTDQVAPPLPTPLPEEVDQPMVVTPEAFTFPDWEGVSGGQRVTSQPRTIVGLTQPVQAFVTGTMSQLQVNDGQPSSNPQMVDDGDIVRVLVKRANATSTSIGSQLTIGNFTTTFTSIYPVFEMSSRETGTSSGGGGTDWDMGGS